MKRVYCFPTEICGFIIGGGHLVAYVAALSLAIMNLNNIGIGEFKFKLMLKFK